MQFIIIIIIIIVVQNKVIKMYAEQMKRLYLMTSSKHGQFTSHQIQL